MDRGYRDIGRVSLAAADYDDYRSYDRPRGAGHLDRLDREPPMRESYLGSPGSSYRAGRSSYGGGSGLDRDIMESILQQRALQQQLSLRESQLALASSLLQQQQQQQFFNKRRMDPRGGDPRQDFKRPRMMGSRSRPRNRSTGGRDSSAGGRGLRGGSGNRRNQSATRGRGRISSDKPRSTRDSYDPENPTVEDDAEIEKDGGKFRCKPCSVDCKDEEDLKKHMSSSQHKDRVADAVNDNDQDDKNRGNKRYCNICDVPLNVNFTHHQRLTFHKKRKVQVTKGCGWCGITCFKNFSEVLEHRATEKHIKNQKLYDKRDRDTHRSDSKSRRDDSRGDSRSSRKEREPIKVELPPELAKFDPKVVVGQSCVIAVSGWFCKLCNKFYNNETAAKETHCMTEPHFNSYKKFMYAKLKAKAEAERDAKEKAAEEEEKKKKEAEVEEKKEEGATEQADGEEPEGEQEGGEEEDAGENGAAEEEEAGAEGEEAGVEGEEGDVEGEEANAEGEEGEAEEEGVGEELLEEPEEEYVDDEEVAIVEENLCETAQEGSEDPTSAGDMEDVEGTSQEEEPMVTEESIEGDGAEAEGAQGEEEEEAGSDKKKATRAAVSSPGRGRGRGASSSRARRGRRVAK